MANPPIIWSGANAKLLKDNLYNQSGTRFALISDVTAGAAMTPESKSASFTAAAAKMYLCDTSASAFTATLPSGAANAQIRFIDSEQTWATYNLTITPASGQKISGLSINESLICDVSNSWCELVWDATNSWWTVTSNGAVNAAAVEYASVSGTWDADTSTTVFGSAGSVTGGALTTNRNKTITWATPIQSTDEFVIEINNGSGWVSADQFGIGYTRQNSINYGVTLTAPTSTTSIVGFQRYYLPSGATYGAAGADWPSNWYWRVRKTSGRSVSYPLVTSTTAGLQPQTTAQTSLTVTSTGWATTRAVGIAYADTAGVWRLKFNIVGTLTGLATDNFLQVTVSGVTFKNTTNYYQSVAVAHYDSTTIQMPGLVAFITPGGSTLQGQWYGVVDRNGIWGFSGDVELESKPTWA